MSKFEKMLANKLHQLPEEKAPERDLWRGIERSIHSQVDISDSEKRSMPYWLSIAATVCVVSSVWFLSAPYQTHKETLFEPEALVNELSLQQQEQVTRLLASYKDVPALTDNWHTQLHELDEAANAIKHALKNEPNNGALIRMLHHIYQQQIVLIERVHAPKWQSI